MDRTPPATRKPTGRTTRQNAGGTSPDRKLPAARKSAGGGAPSRKTARNSAVSKAKANQARKQHTATKADQKSPDAPPKFQTSVARKYPMNALPKKLPSARSTVKNPPYNLPEEPALQETRRENSAKAFIPNIPFSYLARELGLNGKFEDAVGDALQADAEQLVIRLVREADLCRSHANRATILVKDVELARRIRGERN